MELIAGVILIVVLAGSILGIIAWNQTGRLSAELESLKRDVARLALAPRAPAAPPEEPIPGGVEPAPAVPPEPAPAAPAEPQQARQTPPPQAPSQSIEEALTSRWLVWGGSVALAFGGFFLVKFSIEQGWLGPTIRVISGAVLGVLLVVAGEWLRRRPLERALAAIQPSYIPSALTAAGVSILFTSIYAAYALWRILAVLAVGQVFLLQVLIDNVWRVSISVGSSPLFNLLLLGYLAPAGFALLFMREARARGDVRLAHWAGLVALVLGFVWLNSEIRHIFHGGLLGGATTNAELYAYSLGWLAYAGILLVFALRGGGAALRYASLVLVLLTAGKAVFFDMAGLDGIWRALSFIGVGLAAVGVSQLYRRYVFPPRAAP